MGKIKKTNKTNCVVVITTECSCVQYEGYNKWIDLKCPKCGGKGMITTTHEDK